MAGDTLRVKAQNLEKIRSFDEKFSKEKQKVDYFKIFSHFVQSSYGAKRLFKAFYLSCKWSVNFENFLKLSPARVKKIIDLQHRFKNINQSLNITKIPTTLKNIKKISLNVKKNNILSCSKNLLKVAQKIVQTILDIFMFAQVGELFCLYSFGKAVFTIKLSKKVLMLLKGSFVLASDQMKSIKYSKIQEMVKNKKALDNRKIVIFHELKNLDLLKLIKSITLIALSCFLVFEMMFQVALISATLKIALSTIGLVLSIVICFYQKALTYPKISK